MRTLLLIVVLCLFGISLAEEHSHRYNKNENVWVWVNKVGPQSNPHETYPFYDVFPDCKPTDAEQRRNSLGELIEGDAVIKSHIKLQFGRFSTAHEVCTTAPLSEEDVERFNEAIEQRYWFEMYLDEMPVWGHVGNGNGGIYTHLKFMVAYNGDRIVGVNVTGSDPVVPEEGAVIQFRVSATWTVSTVPFERRFDSYLEPMFFEHRVHWFALANGFMLALFLAGVVGILLSRSSAVSTKDEEGGAADDESGWKRLSGEVFRVPYMANWLAAVLGTGAQLFVLACLLITSAVLVEMHTVRGGMTNALVFTYAATALFGGAVSGAYYKRCGGEKWIRTAILTAGALPGATGCVVLLVSIIAYAKGSLAAVPFGAVLSVAAIWGFLALPLCVVGTIAGRNFCGTGKAARVATLPKPIPHGPWYTNRVVLMLSGGLLPFVAAFVETYFVFAGLWHYKLYYVYGFAALALICVLIVAACSAVVAVFVQLSNEDHQWPWTSFGAGASTGVYVFGYSIHYFLFRTSMSGLLQTMLFFGYSALLCIALGILCGTVSFWAVSLFVRHLYGNIKDE